MSEATAPRLLLGSFGIGRAIAMSSDKSSWAGSTSRACAASAEKDGGSGLTQLNLAHQTAIETKETEPTHLLVGRRCWWGPSSGRGSIGDEADLRWR